MQTAGVTFSFEGRYYTLFAKLECLLSDGEGLKFALDVTGFNGIRPCIRCQNVLRKGSGLASRRPGFVEVGCVDRAKFVASTPQDLEREVNAVVAARADVHAGTRSETSLKRIEKAYGIHGNPQGLLCCPILRQCFSILHVLNEDWMHGALQDGCLTIAFQVLMSACRTKLSMSLDRVELFLKADWKFPRNEKSRMRPLWNLFSASA